MIRSTMSRTYIRFSFTRLDVMINFLRRMEILYWFWEMKVQMLIKMFSVPLLLRTGQPCHWGKLVFIIKYLKIRFRHRCQHDINIQTLFFSFLAVLLLETLIKKITGIVTLKRSMSTQSTMKDRLPYDTLLNWHQGIKFRFHQILARKIMRVIAQMIIILKTKTWMMTMNPQMKMKKWKRTKNLMHLKLDTFRFYRL